MSDEKGINRKDRVILGGISPRAWEHPADRAALIALKKIPGLNTLLQKLIGATTERSLRLLSLSSAVRVNQRQFPRVYELHQHACNVLDATYQPEVYVTLNPFFNAGAIGVEKPFITLNTTTVDSLTDDELLFILAHELGHCISGHVLYKTVLAILVRMSTMMFSIPLGGLPLLGIIGALREWDRKSELSADRAGLLAVQDPTVVYGIMMKMAGGKNEGQMNFNEFLLQAQEYQTGGTAWDGALRLLNLFFQTHPFPVLRLSEIKAWVESGEYTAILNGSYRKRGEDGEEENIFSELKSAAGTYKDGFDQSKDPLTDFVKSVFETAGQTAGKMRDTVSDWMNSDTDDPDRN